MERFGTHRSVSPPRALPQQADVLDATSPLRGAEFSVDVDYLNIDSASWRLVFLINVPLIAVTMAAAVRSYPSSTPNE